MIYPLRWFVPPPMAGTAANREKYNDLCEPHVSARIVNTEAEKALELNRRIGLEKLMGKASDKFTIAFNQTVKLPDENGGTYRLAFDSRNQVIGQNRYDQMVLLNFHDGSDPRPGRGKTTRNYIYSKISAGPQWHPYSYEFTAENTRPCNLNPRGRLRQDSDTKPETRETGRSQDSRYR